MLNTHAQYFIQVAKTGSFTKAAENLFVSQSTISKRIAQMEKDLGITLFERTTRKVRLTRQGQVVYNFLIDCTGEWEQALSTAKMVSEELEHTLNVGLLHGWRVKRLPTKGISRFAQKYPFVELNIEKHTYRGMLDNLKNGSLDVIFSIPEEMRCEDDDDWWDCKQAYTDPLILYFSSKHPITKQENIWDSLKNVRVYMMDQTASRSTVPSITQHLQAKGLDMTVHACPNFETMSTAVDEQKGGAITALSSHVCESSDYRYYDLDLYIDVLCFWRKDSPKKILRHFINMF